MLFLLWACHDAVCSLSKGRFWLHVVFLSSLCPTTNSVLLKTRHFQDGVQDCFTNARFTVILLLNSNAIYDAYWSRVPNCQGQRACSRSIRVSLNAIKQVRFAIWARTRTNHIHQAVINIQIKRLDMPCWIHIDWPDMNSNGRFLVDQTLIKVCMEYLCRDSLLFNIVLLWDATAMVPRGAECWFTEDR